MSTITEGRWVDKNKLLNNLLPSTLDAKIFKDNQKPSLYMDGCLY